MTPDKTWVSTGHLWCPTCQRGMVKSVVFSSSSTKSQLLWKCTGRDSAAADFLIPPLQLNLSNELQIGLNLYKTLKVLNYDWQGRVCLLHLLYEKLILPSDSAHWKQNHFTHCSMAEELCYKKKRRLYGKIKTMSVGKADGGSWCALCSGIGTWDTFLKFLGAFLTLSL